MAPGPVRVCKACNARQAIPSFPGFADAAWVALAKLVPLVWQPSIPNINTHVVCHCLAPDIRSEISFCLF